MRLDSSGEFLLSFGVVAFCAGIVVIVSSGVDGSPRRSDRGNTAPAAMGFVCGDDVCESGAGEDSCNCPRDCGDPPSGESPLLNCTDGLDNDCDGDTDCADADCAGDPDCASCGDGTCVFIVEDSCSCPADCGAPPDAEVPGSTCNDGLDNDCEGGTDCDDADCDADPLCAPSCGDGNCDPGDLCNCPQDCSNEVPDPVELPGSTCGNGADDDCDGVADCDDGDCFDAPNCIAAGSFTTDQFPHAGRIRIDFADIGGTAGLETIVLAGNGLTAIRRESPPYTPGQVVKLRLESFELVGSTVAFGDSTPIIVRNRGVSLGVLNVFAVNPGGVVTNGSIEIDIFYEIEIPELGIVVFNSDPVSVKESLITQYPPFGSVLESDDPINPAELFFELGGVDCGDPQNTKDFLTTVFRNIPDESECTFHRDCGEPLEGYRCVDGVCAIRSDTIVADDGTRLNDLDVDLIIRHAARGDLTVDVENLSDGVKVRLADRDGGPADDIGDPDAGTPLTFDDEAATAFAVEFNNSPTGSHQPRESLGAFDGLSKKGTWRLTVIDHSPNDTGMLVDWSLHFCNSVNLPAADLAFAEHSVIQCTQDCRDRAVLEGDPECPAVNFVDTTNGGCDAAVPAFFPLTESGLIVCGSAGSVCVENCVPPCVVNGDCVDGDVCTFDNCVDNGCSSVSAKYGDLAGIGGSCGPDGNIELVDILAVLDGFSGNFAAPCESNNLDIAGPGGTCTVDGIIGLDDILAVLNAFQGQDDCSCPPARGFGGPEPVFGFDTDWYELVLTEDSRITWEVSADFDVETSIVRAGRVDPCTDTVFITSGSGVPCELVTLDVAVTGPDTYYLTVAPTDTGEVEWCGNYNASVDFEPSDARCPGEGDCCDPAGNGTPGCSDYGCCETVCDQPGFAYCCTSFGWDNFCAEVALTECGLCTP